MHAFSSSRLTCFDLDEPQRADKKSPNQEASERNSQHSWKAKVKAPLCWNMHAEEEEEDEEDDDEKEKAEGNKNAAKQNTPGHFCKGCNGAFRSRK